MDRTVFTEHFMLFFHLLTQIWALPVADDKLESLKIQQVHWELYINIFQACIDVMNLNH